MYHSFSFTDECLGHFQHLTIVNCAAMNVGVHRFFRIGVSDFLGYNPSSGILLIFKSMALTYSNFIVELSIFLFNWCFRALRV